MFVLLFVLRNAFRHKLRTTLTVVGIVVAIVAFGVLRTIVDAWYAGANASSSARLVTRNSVSLTFSLPLTYAQKLRQVSELTRMVQELALCDIRRRHPHADEREQQLRLASRWLDAETMRQVFGWDLDREGY